MKEDQARGRKRPLPDEESLRKERVRNKDNKILLESWDWNQFKVAISDLGLKPGMQEYDDLVRLWKDYYQNRLEQERQSRKRPF